MQEVLKLYCQNNKYFLDIENISKNRNVYNIIKKYNYNSKLGCGIVEDLYKKQAETNKTNWIKQIIKQL